MYLFLPVLYYENKKAVHTKGKYCKVWDGL